MKRNLTKPTLLPLILLCIVSVSWADSKIKAKYTSGGKATENTVYSKGSRQRFDLESGLSMINQCDLRKMIQINDKARSYIIMPTDQVADSTVATATAAGTPQSNQTLQAQKGIVTFTTTVNDTGERKKLFGYEARHVKSTLVKQPSPEACDQKKERIETDGWYIDFDQNFVCPMGQAGPVGTLKSTKTECGNEIRNNIVGTGKLGYPLLYVMTTYDEHGQVSQTLSMEVLQFSTVPLDAALFDVPAGYTQARDYEEFASLSSGAPAQSKNVSLTSRLAGAKQPGAVRIGVAEVKAGAGRPVSASLKDRLTGFILDSKVDAVPLSGKSSEGIGAEAQQRQCDYILFTDIAEVKKSSSGRFGGMLSKVSSVTSGAMAGEPAKEKYEAKVEYKLFSVGNTSPKLASSVTGKTGGGFNWHSAMSLASTAGSLALMSKGFMGFNPQMMNLFMGMGGRGGLGLGSPLMGLDPAMSGMMSMMHKTQSMTPQIAAPAGNPGENDAIADALGNVAKAVVAGLEKKK